jgi:hypothetical protein
MKTKCFLITFLIVSVSSAKIFSQEYTSIVINNLPYETARQVINKAFEELNLTIMHVWKNKTSAESGFYKYNTLIAKNRLKFKVNVEPNKLTVAIFNRQYLSKSQWVNNVMPMNKKQAAKILKPIKKKIMELTSNINN